MGVKDRDVSQASECGVCRKEREEKERKESEDKGKQVRFNNWISVIPRDGDKSMGLLKAWEKGLCS